MRRDGEHFVINRGLRVVFFIVLSLFLISYFVTDNDWPVPLIWIQLFFWSYLAYTLFFERKSDTEGKA